MWRQKIWEREGGCVSGGGWWGGRGCLVGCFGVGSAGLKKFQTSWLAKRCLVLLFRRPTSVYRSTVYVHSGSNRHAVSVCFRNPPKYHSDYVIFNVPTWSFNTYVYTRVCLYRVFCETEWLPFSWRLRGFGGGLGPLLWNPRSNPVLWSNAINFTTCVWSFYGTIIELIDQSCGRYWVIWEISEPKISQTVSRSLKQLIRVDQVSWCRAW